MELELTLFRSAWLDLWLAWLGMARPAWPVLIRLPCRCWALSCSGLLLLWLPQPPQPSLMAARSGLVDLLMAGEEKEVVEVVDLLKEEGLKLRRRAEQAS